MKLKINNKALIGFITAVSMFLSAGASFADPVTYTYDATNRLIRANDNGAQVDYVYDSVGNLQQRLSFSAASTPPSKDFGSINVGSASTAQTFTIMNTGSEHITIGTAVLAGADSASFSLSGNTCDGQTLAPSSSCMLQAAFFPLMPGPKIADILLSITSPSTLTLAVPLTGSGFSLLTVSITPSSTGSVIGNGINCPGDCSEIYSATEPSVQLSVLPNAGYLISSVTGCEGTLAGNIYTTGPIASDCTVTANFAPIPTYSISGNVSSGDVCPPCVVRPLAGVTMTLSGAASGTTTTDNSGIYTFSGLYSGGYTVTPGLTGYTFTPANRAVTVSDADITEQFFIYIALPVRLTGAIPMYYPTLQAAYNAAATGDTIQAKAQTFIENLTINRNVVVTLQGGYDNTFSSYSGRTSSLKGALATTAGGGTLTIRNFILLQ
ncbi:MAG: choice-of-anchor D domain-containing protein [Nitrospirae bacterium]|nr:choice-of-anchor D domain-containing protein [Nitrospirota bacterium]